MPKNLSLKGDFAGHIVTSSPFFDKKALRNLRALEIEAPSLGLIRPADVIDEQAWGGVDCRPSLLFDVKCFYVSKDGDNNGLNSVNFAV